MNTPALPWYGVLAGPVGARFLRASRFVGASTLLFVAVLRSLVRAPVEWRETVRQMRKIGYDSLPIVIFTALFAGLLMVIQSVGLSSKIDMRHMLGWGAGYAILREVGPVLIGLMFSGRVGANIAAELGTMTVTEQIDGLRALAIDPMRFLVVPRFLGVVIMLTCLLVVGNVIALAGAMAGANLMLGVEPQQFWTSFFKLIRLADLFNGLLKIVLFAVIIVTVACTAGLAPKTGAREVGAAVNTTVVTAALGILLVDYLITVLLP
jgi:phospholipid/cholesterol/gamma-HCH transport system permease protein